MRFLHKWLGLTSGLIVFIVSITGCIYCFHDEIKDITRKEWRFVEVENKPFISPSILRLHAMELVPGSSSGMVAYHGKNRSAVVYTHNDKGEFLVYFNPYSGQYLKTEEVSKDFFEVIKNIHMYLLLPKEIGKQIIGASTIIFVLMIISGLIQWWPKKRSDLKKRLAVKWSAKWRRVNYDWHNISGFYISILGIIIALTGLVFNYEWFEESIYYAANLGGNLDKDQQLPVIDTLQFRSNSLEAVDKAMLTTIQKEPSAEMFFVTFPQKKSEMISTGAYPYSLRFDHQSNYHFHPASAQLLKSNKYNDKSPGLQIVEMSYGIHTGQILNLAGKIMAFIASLVASALPVTGFVIWYGRNNKKKSSK